MLETKLSLQSLAKAICCCLLFASASAAAQEDCANTAGGTFSIIIDTTAINIGPTTNLSGPVDLTGYNTYRLYVQCDSPDDLLQAVAGDSSFPTSLTTTTSFYQDPLGNWSEIAYNPLLFAGFPGLEFDSFLSIGLTAPAVTGNGESAPQMAEDAGIPITGVFEGGGNLVIDTFEGASWFVADAENATNCAAGEDLKVFFAQVTTDGSIDGQVFFQMYRNGTQSGANCVNPYLDVTPQTSGGCTDTMACNYDAAANVDDGSCDYCICADTTIFQTVSFPNDSLPNYSLEIELIADHDTTEISALSGMKTYRFYVRTDQPDEKLTAVYGDSIIPLDVQSTTGFFQSTYGGVTPNTVNPVLFSSFPELEYDSWVTIGIDKTAGLMGSGFADVYAISDPNTPPSWIASFDPGGGVTGGNIFTNSPVGGSWFAFTSTANVIPDADQRVLIGQFTTDGIISGSLGAQILPPGISSENSDYYKLRFDFTTEILGVPIISNYPEDICGCISDVDSDGLCDQDDNCIDLTACNYSDTLATECLTLDVIGVCGGDCTEDADEDGICDDVDNCVGALDACNVCNGPGAIYDCGCYDLGPGWCDCFGNQLDALGECGGDCEADVNDNGICDNEELLGCTNPDADNFNPNANVDDGNCLFEGCTDPTAANFDDAALTDDGSCIYPGCTDSTAWNYDSGANEDDGSCQANACGVDGALVQTTSFAFTPAQLSIATGGTVVWQNMSDGDLHNVNGDVDSQTGISFGNPQSFILMSVAGSTEGTCIGSVTFNTPGIYQYDCSIGNCAEQGMVGTILVGAAGCTDSQAANYNPDADYDNGLCLYWGCTDTTACNFDPNADVPNGTCIFADGTCEVCDGAGGIATEDADSDGVCDGDEILGCTDSTACNYDSTSTTDTDNSLCIFPETDCALCSGNQDGTGTVITNDDDGDGICNDLEVPGCADNTACNFDNAATDDDGSCLFAVETCQICFGDTVLTLDDDGDGICNDDEILGCMDSLACNFDSLATDADESCLFITNGCDTCVDGAIVDNDADDDGICDPFEVAGCTDSLACNYGPTFTDDDGSCIFLSAPCETCEGGEIFANDDDDDGICNADEVIGCQDTTACNYDELATDPGECTFTDGLCQTCEEGQVVDNDDDGDGVCNEDEIVGCQDTLACNFDELATDSDSTLCAFASLVCESCFEGAVILNDDDGDGVCDADEITGCADTTACNFNDLATDSDSTLCTYLDGLCQTCEGGLVVDNDDDGDGICNSLEIAGCTDSTACNFDSLATDDDLTCVFAEFPCESCEGLAVILNDADGDGVCDPDEILGCTDSTACNYDSTSTTDTDNSLCLYTDTECATCSGEQDGTGTVVSNDEDGDGICDSNELLGCTDSEACNYNSEATENDDSCEYEDALGVCGGLCPSDMDNDGICDNEDACIGQYDALGICNGNCPADIDGDDICDNIDDCVGNYDAIGVCNGDCIEDADDDDICDSVDDCVGTPDALGVCNGDCPADVDQDGVCDNAEILGCTDESACNYAADATEDDGSCAIEDALGICGGSCAADDDNDNICDDVDPCVGQFDALGDCNGGCGADIDNDEICDNVDPCVGQYDALGICNGDCPADVDQDGVCDNAEVLGCTDEAACNFSPNATEEDGSCQELDALSECGGSCSADEDGDGICDDVDDCVGEYDALGECNGTCAEDVDADGVCDDAEILGCTDANACNFNELATEEDGSCTVEDAIGICGGSCSCDQNNNGICDDEELGCPDFNDNGICDGSEVFGCTYADACNYSELATADDGSCTYALTGFDCDGNNIDAAELFYGCTYEEAINYSAAADLDNGSCVFLDVITGIGPCYFDVTDDGIVNTPDLLILLQYWEASCVE